MPGYNGKSAGEVSMRHWDARISGDRNGAADAGNNDKGYPGGAAGFGFLSAAPKHKRIAALEPRHVQALLRVRDDLAIDVILAQCRLVRLFPHINKQRAEFDLVEQRAGRQPIIENDVGITQQAQSLDGNQFGIGWSGADQIDGADLRHAATPDVPGRRSSTTGRLQGKVLPILVPRVDPMSESGHRSRTPC